MPFTAPKTESNFEIVPEGSHGAVVQAIISLGYQDGGKFGTKRRIAITFQLPGLFRTDGLPQNITRAFTFSMHKKAKLREFVEGIYGKKFPDEKTAEVFDFALLIGRACLVSVTHTSSEGKTYANVSSAVAIPSGMPKPVLIGDPLIYHDDLSGTEKSAAYARVPDWLKEKIDKQLPAPQGKAASREPGDDDEIPWDKAAA